MSQGDAQGFIKQGMKDAKMRGELNLAKTSDDLFAMLAQHDFTFTYPEFDDAFHHLLTHCEFEEQADLLREFKMWWDLTVAMAQQADKTAK